ncbi:GntR family transcriptional regulator [Virgibacillus sp. 179-BFC.A HS]|uniref:GntR family transcriptional regulator n=1 Tax=Tigheibacillus jepli TaxID=3035914 RepID=A0ABU5CGA5_9BACI|nr:GntR family transcriptional regulator [Virgibacillus sp. 179-BFC.A HS]MDY0405348.1 GntR family transcriptional regulator [Virgibacillus sp. 179-BFC.A HS]
MAGIVPPKQKVYQAVLKEIRTYIEEHHLQPGDKLPSERELAEKLDAGRSSIREALRAMELLGLIETRRGEGTFLTTYQPYQSVELLSSFILKNEASRKNCL